MKITQSGFKAFKVFRALHDLSYVSIRAQNSIDVKARRGKLYCQPDSDKLPTFYKEGETKKIKGELVICENGLHFCPQLTQIPHYYNFGAKVFIGKVFTRGKYVSDANVYSAESKCASKSLVIEKILPYTEVLNLLNIKKGKRATINIAKSQKEVWFNTPFLSVNSYSKHQKQKYDRKVTVMAEGYYYKGWIPNQHTIDIFLVTKLV